MNIYVVYNSVLYTPIEYIRLYKENIPQTRVCNVAVTHIRPNYLNIKEWCNDPQNVYIGRKGIVFIDGERYPKKDSIWANPFKLKDIPREQALDQYKKYITNRLANEPLLVKELHKLKGKTLGCWCRPLSCHGDVLVELLNL